MREPDAVLALGALAQETRLRLFRALVVAGPTGMTPGHLAEVVDAGGSVVSFHLKELTRAGLVAFEREGRHLIYRARIDAMNDLLTFLTANCCQGQPCLDASAATCTSGPAAGDVPLC